jgi:hypothetical protein
MIIVNHNCSRFARTIYIWPGCTQPLKPDVPYPLQNVYKPTHKMEKIVNLPYVCTFSLHPHLACYPSNHCTPNPHPLVGAQIRVQEPKVCSHRQSHRTGQLEVCNAASAQPVAAPSSLKLLVWAYKVSLGLNYFLGTFKLLVWVY